MFTVTLSNQKTFLAEQGRTLLDNSKSQGVILEYSCRTGRCGVCKAKILHGDTNILQEEQALNEEERVAGYILTCCRSALSDLELGIEDLGQMAGIQAKTLPCRVDSIDYIAVDIAKVVLRVPPRSSFDYLPGQYVNVIWREGVRRSYSVANAPREDGRIELHIRKVPMGVMSKYWFDEVKANDLLRLEGPLGTFFLRNTLPGNLVFLATGTGMAPVKAMLEALAAVPEQSAGKCIYVYWGARTEADLYWTPQFPQMNVTFIPVLSRVGAQWSGRVGHIQQALLADGIDLTDSVVYACGSDAMIHSACETLTSAGLTPENFYSDAFVSSN